MPISRALPLPCVQIAGIHDLEEALLLHAAGVHAVGLPLRLPINAEDLTEVQAAALVHQLPQGIIPVGITYIDNAAEAADFCHTLGIHHLQLHGPISPQELATLRRLMPHIYILKSLVVRPAHTFGPSATAFAAASSTAAAPASSPTATVTASLTATAPTAVAATAPTAFATVTASLTATASSPTDAATAFAAATVTASLTAATSSPTAVAATAPPADNRTTLLHEVQTYAPLVDAFITDTFNPATGASGATGMTHDWAASRTLVEHSPRPVILAGGLNPGNVYNAIRAVGPAGVDAHTGVEGPDGRKSPALVDQFVREAIRGFAV